MRPLCLCIKPFRFPCISRFSFGNQIALVILIKLLLLAWLWNAFFSAPQTKKMRLPTAQVEQHLLSARHVAGPSNPYSAAEDLHDPH